MPVIYSFQPTTARQSLLVLRIIWGAMLFSQLLVLVIFLFLLKNGNATPQPATGHLLFVVSSIMLVTLLPIGWLIRRAILRPGADGLIDRTPFSTGNIVFYAMCEGPSFAGLIGIFVGGSYWPNLIVPIVAMAVLALSFPVGDRLRGDSAS
jgi:hypothetical protein